jgi:hypothetical protein
MQINLVNIIKIGIMIILVVSNEMALLNTVDAIPKVVF